MRGKQLFQSVQCEDGLMIVRRHPGGQSNLRPPVMQIIPQFGGSGENEHATFV